MDEFEKKIRRHTVAGGIFSEDGFNVPYRVLRPDFESRLPCFAGGNPTLLFISQDVPSAFCQFVLWHEATCIIRRAGELNGCRKTTGEELARVPPALLADYIRMRLSFYDALLALTPTGQFYNELAGSIELLKSRIS